MELPPEIAAEIRRRIELYRQEKPGALSPDGRALRVCGSIGYDAWMTPDGDVWLETYDIPNEDNRVEDRSRRAQILVLTLGIRTLPELEVLLPVRTTTAISCPVCQGAGRFDGPARPFVCVECSGLGWVETKRAEER